MQSWISYLTISYQFCADGGSTAEVGQDILTTATDIRLTLLDVLEKINQLLGSKAASGNFRVRELLLGKK